MFSFKFPIYWEKKSWKNSTAIKSYERNKKKLMRKWHINGWTGWSWVQSRAGALFLAKKYFPGVFKWFRLHKKVSLTTLGPSGMPGGVTHGPSQAPYGQNGQNGQKWPKITQKWLFLTFKVFILKMIAILPWLWICRLFFF